MRRQNIFTFTEGETATSIKPCPVGEARSDSFFNDNETTKFTTCKECDWKKGEWQDEEGQIMCKEVSAGYVVGKQILILNNFNPVCNLAIKIPLSIYRNRGKVMRILSKGFWIYSLPNKFSNIVYRLGVEG